MVAVGRVEDGDFIPFSINNKHLYNAGKEFPL